MAFGESGARARRVRALAASGLAALILALALAAPADAATGAWSRAWGKDVVTGGPAVFEICIVAANCSGGSGGALGGELNLPNSVATDSAGNVYVADLSNNRVEKFDSSGNFLRAWGQDVVVGGGTGYEICTVAANCKAGDGGNGLGGVSPGGQMLAPAGIAAAGGNVYVVEAGDPFNSNTRSRVQKFDSDGNFLRAWGKDVDSGGGTGFEICTVAANCQVGIPGGLGGELTFTADVATDATGAVYVSDTSNFVSTSGSRIQKFDSDGNFSRAWGKDVVTGGGTGFETCTAAANCKTAGAGDLGGEMVNASGTAVSATGDVYVSDSGNRRIQKFDSDGTFDRAWGTDVDTGGGTGAETCTTAATCKAGVVGTTLGGDLQLPLDVATDAAGDVYVSDLSLVRIQKFTSSGSFLRTWGKNVLAGGGTGFELCTVAANCKTGEAGGLGGEIRGPRGIATNSAGDLYLADSNSTSRIQKFAGPELPTLTGPSSPANDNSIELTGTSDAGTTVTIYDDGTCTGGVVGTLSATNFASPGFSVPASDDSTSTFSVTASNADGTTACSASFTYVEDSPPAAPTIDFILPLSGSNDNNPAIYGTAQGDATVKIYATANCSGAEVGSDSGSTFGNTGIPVTVPNNSSTTFSATATDAGGTSGCSPTPLTYQEITPGPSFNGSDFTDNENDINLTGTAPAGTTVRLYNNGTCSGTPIQTITAAEFASPGFPVTVADNSVTTYSADTTDVNGASLCSDPITYTEDSIAPAAPTNLTTNPPSPANSQFPQFKGTAEAGTTVSAYDADCVNQPTNIEVSAASFQADGIQVFVNENTETTLRFKARDQAGNFSACSDPITYIQVPGSCTIFGTGGDETLNGTPNADVICGLGGNDTINAGDGNDIIDGGAGNDTLNGGLGTDRMTGGFGDDTFDGGAGIDRALYDTANNVVEVTIEPAGATPDDGVPGEADHVTDTVESITGGPFDDTLTGSCLANTLAGQGGNDTLNGDPAPGCGGDFMGGGTGDDTISGGNGINPNSGVDTVTYTASPDPVAVSLDNDQNDADGLGGTDNIFGDIDIVYGTAGADTIDAAGAEQGVSLFGRAGDDNLIGSPFNDFLRGEAGPADVLDCRGGENDMYSVAPDGNASVTDCETLSG